MSRALARRAIGSFAEPRTPTVIAGWIGFAFGAAGASVLALNLPWSGWGWLAFLGSNFAWIAHARWTRTTSHLLQQLVFLVTSIVGIWRWLA